MDDSTLAWRELYEAALMELDPQKLLTRIEAAKQAIQARRAAVGGLAR
jgi:hypothetical protein